MNSYLDTEFLDALFASATFLRALGVWGGLSLACVLVAAGLMRRIAGRVPLRRLHSDVRGVASAVDFILTLPFFLTVILLSVQFAVLLNASMIVHYSAFAAARSARVWIVESTANSLQLGDFMYLSPDAKRNAELAARFALIAAAPADPEIRTAPSSAPKQVLAKMAEAGGRPSRSEVLGRKAGYAFDPGNVDVDISYSLLSRSPEVTATVVFQQPCGILIGRVFGTNRGDNVYVTPITAEVTLL